MFRAPPVQRINLCNMQQQYHEQEDEDSPTLKESQVKQTVQKKSQDYHKAEPTEVTYEEKWFIQSQIETVVDADTRRYMDAASQFNRINYVQHSVISIRSIFKAEEYIMQTTLDDNFHKSDLARNKSERMSVEVHAQRLKRSSTEKLSEKELMDFTLGNKQNGNDILQFAVSRLKKSNASSDQEGSPDQYSAISIERTSQLRKSIVDDTYSPSQVPPTIQSSASAYKQVPYPYDIQEAQEQTTAIFSNADEAVTARVLNLDSARTFYQKKQGDGQASITSTKFKQFNMFRSMKNRSQISPSGVTNEETQMRLYEQRATEMRPLTLKKLNLESPEQMMQRQHSDISIPLSLAVGDETQLSRLKLQVEQKSTTSKQPANLQHLAQDDELGQIIRSQHEDEVLQEKMPKKVNDGPSHDSVRNKSNNLFGYAQISQNQDQNPNDEELEEAYETGRILEGPLIQPGDSSQHEQLRELVKQENNKKSNEPDITSPHFNQDVFQFVDDDEKEKKQSSSVQKFEQVNEIYGEGIGLMHRGSDPSNGYILSDHETGIENKPYDPAPNQAQYVRDMTTENPQIEQQSISSSNIFISNMNININLNININMPQDRVVTSSRNSEFPDLQTGVAGLGKNQQANHDQQHLSTILDEQLMGEVQHRPKPSLGSKIPPTNSKGKLTQLQAQHEAIVAAENSAQKQILDQINPKELVEAVSQHFQMKTQSQRTAQAQDARTSLQPSMLTSCDLRTEQKEDVYILGEGSARNNRQLSELNQRKESLPQQLHQAQSISSIPEEQRMFLSKTLSQQQSLPLERKKFHASQAFLNRQNYNSNSKESSRSNGPTPSENLETSVLGMTPAKPEFQQSALKDKQNHRTHLLQPSNGGCPLQGDHPIKSRELIFDSHNVPYSYRTNSQLGQQLSPKFKDGPENKEELFAGRAPAQGQHNGDMGNLMEESDDKMHRNDQKIFGYMLTDNAQSFTQKKQDKELADQHALQSNAMVSASVMRSFSSRMNGEASNGPNKYTLGNIKHNDQQLTIPSLTQQSQFVMNTGVSDLGGQSPINIPMQLAGRCGSPVGIEQRAMAVVGRRKASLGMSQGNPECVVQNSGESNRQSPPLKPLTAQSQLLERCESLLKLNLFLKEFRIIVDLYEPNWVKYEALYKKLAHHILVNSSASKSVQTENREQKDALMCLELLVEVLTLQPCAILPDLIHLMTKGNLMKARNDMIDTVSATLTLQREQLIQTKSSQLESEQTQKRMGQLSAIDLAPFNTFSLSMAFMEAQNAKSIHDVYKKIQINKFPTISKNLGLFLKNKREIKKSNEKKVKATQKEDCRRTQNIPQSLQKRVKISMIAKPQMFEEPLNESIFTPRDSAIQITRQSGPIQIQPSPNQSIPRHPTKLASQMKQLNAVSVASRPGFHSKLQHSSESFVDELSSRKSFLAAKNEESPQQCSIDTSAINLSRELPAQIQPIRNIMSPKGFFPNNNP